AARLRDRKRVHVGDALAEDRAEEATDERERERRGRAPGELAGIREAHLLHPPLGHLREEAPELLGEPEPWRRLAVRLRVHGREIDRVDDDAVPERVGDLL